MKIKQYNLITSSIFFLFSISGLALLIFGLIKLDHLLFILHQYLHIEFNEFTSHFYRDIQIRCFYSGIFIIGIAIILILFRKKISGLLYEFYSSSKDILKGIKVNLSRQFSGYNLRYTISLFVILLFSILIRLYFINCPLRYDEGFTFFYFTKKSFFLLFFYYEYPNHHIFHTFLVKISSLIFGNSVISMRLPAFIFGISLIPLVYMYVSKFYHKNAAILASSFVSVSSILISYSVNARGYTLIYCAFISLLIIVEILKKYNNTFLWGMFILLQIIGLYTIPTMIYACMIIYMYLLMMIYFDKNNSYLINVKKLFLSGIIVGISAILLYLPVCLLMGWKSILSNVFVESKPYDYIFTNMFSSLQEFYLMFTTDMPVLLQLFFFLGIIISLFVYKQARFFLFAFIICLFFAFFIQRVIPYNRVLVFIFPLFFILSALGIYFIINIIFKTKQYLVVLIVSSIVVTFLSFNTVRSNSPSVEFDFTPIKKYDAVLTHLKKSVGTNDRLLCMFPMEASIKSYCYFYNIPISSFSNDPINSDKVFIIVGEKFVNTPDSILCRSEVNRTIFYNKFRLKSTKKYSDKTIIYEFQSE